MRVGRAVAAALIAGLVAWAGNARPVVEPKVPVCLVAAVGFDLAARVKMITSQMFAAIGVTIEWRTPWRNCPAQAIRISLTSNTPATLPPGALAYAFPYEGTHIRVVYDRIVENHNQNKVLTGYVLAHVLAHEITRILQGTCRHSDYGLMKAEWDERDFRNITWAPSVCSSPKKISI
jgi:hypothetical protein